MKQTLLLLMSVLGLACAPTETGNPPATPPQTPPETGIDDAFVISALGGPTNCDDADMLDGGGCAFPTRQQLTGMVSAQSDGAAVWVFNLRDHEPPAVATVSKAGGFSIVLSYFGESPIYRLQLRTSAPEVFYRPRDFSFQALAGDTTRSVTHPREDCLNYVHTVRWNDNGSALVSIDNQCADGLSVQSTRSWSGDSQIVAAPAQLDAGQPTVFEVSGEIENDLLIIETGSTAEEQIAIHLVP